MLFDKLEAEFTKLINLKANLPTSASMIGYHSEEIQKVKNNIENIIKEYIKKEKECC